MGNYRATCVMIVGGGPAGLLSALLLARAGVPCTLFEQHEGLSTHPKAMGVKRRTAEIFRHLGLLDRMMEADFSGPDTSLMIWAKSMVGEEFGRAPLPVEDFSVSPCRAYHCPQTHTEAVLLEALKAEPLADVRFGHRVSGLRDVENGVEVDVAGPEAKEIWRAEWLIAADGAASPIRRQLGIAAEGPGDLGHFLNTFFRADPGQGMAGRKSLLYNILREDLVEFLVSVNGRDLWLMHHFLQPGEDAAKFSTEGLTGMIRSAFGVPDLGVEILGKAPWVMSPKVSSRFRDGRVFFTGDAAARLSPAGGLGMNTGLQSAHNLAWKLAAVIRGDALESLLDSYERERLDVSVGVMRHANDNSGEVFRQVDCALRGDFDGLRKLIAESDRQKDDAPFDIGIRYGEFGRFPHAWLMKDGLRQSTLDLVGGSFVAFVGPGAAVDHVPGVELVRGQAYEDPEFPSREGFSGSGAVLVRPDGYVAWRQSEGATGTALRDALAGALR